MASDAFIRFDVGPEMALFARPSWTSAAEGCQAHVAVSRIVFSQLWNDSRFHILDEPFAINAVPSQNLVQPGNASELCRLGIGSA